jgi:ABC-type nitrate/sulfonate/bicarbonate transport system ATPase subunit
MKSTTTQLLQVVCGVGERTPATASFIQTSYQEQLLAQLLQSHLVGDFCIIGPRGCGKSATVNRLAALLNYQVEPIVLYQVGILLNTNMFAEFYFH